MTPRERVSDERRARDRLVAYLEAEQHDTIYDDVATLVRAFDSLSVESIEGGEIVSELTARLARIEAWAARAIELFATFDFEPVNGPLVERVVGWPSSDAIGRHLRAYPTPGRDAPATSEGEGAPATAGREATEAASSGDTTSEGVRAGHLAAHAPSLSAADAAADRLRRVLEFFPGDDVLFSYHSVLLTRADIRAVLDSRDAARDEAARLRAALHDAREHLLSAEVALRTPNGLAADGIARCLVRTGRTGLAPASATPQERPE